MSLGLTPLGSPVSRETMIGNGVQNTLQAVRTLWDAGARQIVVVSVADLGTAPLVPFDIWTESVISALCVSYNQTLEAALLGLETAGVPTIRVDGFRWLGNITASPEEFGFANVTDQFLPNGLSVGGDPAQYLFWDFVHPSTRPHRVMADIARNGLIDYYSNPFHLCAGLAAHPGTCRRHQRALCPRLRRILARADAETLSRCQEILITTPTEEHIAPNHFDNHLSFVIQRQNLWHDVRSYPRKCYGFPSS